jgi:hypothetical protein
MQQDGVRPDSGSISRINWGIAPAAVRSRIESISALTGFIRDQFRSKGFSALMCACRRFGHQRTPWMIDRSESIQATPHR